LFCHPQPFSALFTAWMIIAMLTSPPPVRRSRQRHPLRRRLRRRRGALRPVDQHGTLW
jgi:hypothetical protein